MICSKESTSSNLRLEPGHYAAHIGEAPLHAGEWVVFVDLVLEHHTALVVHLHEFPEQTGDRNFAVSYDHLRFAAGKIRQILGMHVEQTRSNLANRLDDV